MYAEAIVAGGLDGENLGRFVGVRVRFLNAGDVHDLSGHGVYGLSVAIADGKVVFVSRICRVILYRNHYCVLFACGKGHCRRNQPVVGSFACILNIVGGMFAAFEFELVVAAVFVGVDDCVAENCIFGVGLAQEGQFARRRFGAPDEGGQRQRHQECKNLFHTH